MIRFRASIAAVRDGLLVLDLLAAADFLFSFAEVGFPTVSRNVTGGSADSGLVTVVSCSLSVRSVAWTSRGYSRVTGRLTIPPLVLSFTLLT